MSSELVKELREIAKSMNYSMDEDGIIVEKAAARIEALEAENARLREALIEIECRPEKMIWGEDTEVYEAMRDMENIARRSREGGNDG